MNVGVTLSLGLIGLVAVMERGGISTSAGQALSVLLALIGLAWTMSGSNTIRRLSELYLWLAFIVSIYYLHFVAEAVARWASIQTIDAFRPIALLHLAAVGAALYGLGARVRNESGLTATLLIIGAVIFWIGARTFPGSSLETVNANMAGHIWTSVNFLIAAIITLVGLALFTRVLHDAGDRYLSALGLLLFAFGAVFWSLHLVFRLTVVVQAAEYWRVSAAAPPWFEPWRQWAAALFAIYSGLAYCGLAAYGIALLETGGLPRWIAWTCIVAGLVAAPLGGLPLFIHVPLWLVGILILTRDYPEPNSRRSDDRMSPFRTV